MAPTRPSSAVVLLAVVSRVGPRVDVIAAEPGLTVVDPTAVAIVRRIIMWLREQGADDQARSEADRGAPPVVPVVSAIPATAIIIASTAIVVATGILVATGIVVATAVPDHLRSAWAFLFDQFNRRRRSEARKYGWAGRRRRSNDKCIGRQHHAGDRCDCGFRLFRHGRFSLRPSRPRHRATPSSAHLVVVRAATGAYPSDNEPARPNVPGRREATRLLACRARGCRRSFNLRLTPAATFKEAIPC